MSEELLKKSDRELRYRKRLEEYDQLPFVERVDGNRGWFYLLDTPYMFLVNIKRQIVWLKGDIREYHEAEKPSFRTVISSVDDDIKDKMLLNVDFFY